MARWSWHFQGWSKQMGALDFAGGTPVHICSGAAVGAYAVFFGLKVKLSRQGERKATRRAHLKSHKEHNVTYVIIGTALLWFGWLGFNGGSALGANLRAVSACMSTHVAACSGGLTGLLIYMAEKYERKWRSQPDGSESTSERSERSDKLSTVAFCDGVIVGLVAITPGAGYVRLISTLHDRAALIPGILGTCVLRPFLRYRRFGNGGVLEIVVSRHSLAFRQRLSRHLPDPLRRPGDLYRSRRSRTCRHVSHRISQTVSFAQEINDTECRLMATLRRDWVVGLDGYTKLPSQSNNHGHQLG